MSVEWHTTLYFVFLAGLIAFGLLIREEEDED
jgi:hypothetical protein